MYSKWKTLDSKLSCEVLFRMQRPSSISCLKVLSEHTYGETLDPRACPASPVGLGEQDGGVGLADEVFISNFADGDHLFLSAGHGLQGQGGLYFWPQHAQVRRQHVDEDLRGQER